MNELKPMNFNGFEVVDSRQVADVIGKNHFDLLRDIRKYCDYLGESKIAVTDFFIESTYTTEQNKEMPCYLCTRKGCEMIANKLTGQKGIVFTALYINAFHEMETHISRTVQIADKKALEIMEMNARTRMAEMLLKLTNVDTLSPEYKNILVAKSAEILTGEALLPLPKSEKTYSAGDIAEMFNVTSQKIGRIAKKYNMKTDEYGSLYRDKSPYSSKEVDVFRYNDKAIEKFRDIFTYELT